MEFPESANVKAPGGFGIPLWGLFCLVLEKRKILSPIEKS
jgi:hypothetical protein